MHSRMYQQDLDIGQPDGHSTFHLAVHHLQLAAAMFDRFPPEMYMAVKEVHAADIPDAVKGMLAAVTAQMELDIWLREWKAQAAREMVAYSDTDPAIEPIWDRYAAALQERLAAAGRSPKEIESELGDMGNTLLEFREVYA